MLRGMNPLRVSFDVFTFNDNCKRLTFCYKSYATIWCYACNSPLTSCDSVSNGELKRLRKLAINHIIDLMEN